MLSRSDLFARLAQGHAAGITVVTPNRRLAQALQGEFDAHQSANGLTAWEAPDILPFGAFVERLWENALYSPIGEKLPLLLTPAQEQRLWEEILAASGLLAIPQAAAHCREAWGLLHAWRIGPGQGNEDAAAFSRWSNDYQRRTKGEIDAARLPDLMVSFMDEIKKPALLVAYGFDILPPQTREFLEKLDYVPCRPAAVQGSARRTSYASARLELEAAAAWARERLEQGRSRIGVVVPGLARRRKEVQRVFSRVMRPGFNLPGSAAAPMPFNLSLGAPLADFPLVEAISDLLELASRPVAFACASRLVRSPFVGGADAEMAPRARLDAKLRRTLEASVTLPKLIASVDDCPKLRGVLENLFKINKVEKRSAGEWARHFSAVLEAAGFPGERTLDSAEFQTRAKWHETLGEFAKLERTTKEMSFGDAFSCLERLCADTLFQPESAEAPIQVLGVLESAGLRFDCLWVSGLTDEAWPLAARPNPFIPVALQKQAGIPQASAEGSLELDRRLTQEWLGAAAEVVLSYPKKEADRELAPSPLILAIEESALALPELPRYRDLIFSNREMTSVEDERGPRVAPGAVRGGTRVLADQAACPFRAFAHWRLHAQALEEPAAGPDARDRGKLLHELMKEIWAQLKGSSSLKGDLEPVISRAADAAVRTLGLEGRFAELERGRLAKLAREWLELEKSRPPFEVLHLEERREISIAGLSLSGRIDRMDRLVEKKARGGHVLIDYKTGGNVSPKAWDPPRPDDPQLALYAVSAPEEIAAVAFAAVRPGAMKFMGYSRAEGMIPNVKGARDWPALLAAWRQEAEALGRAFAAGEARVDPKNDLATCRLCDLQTLCRVYEKFSALAEADE
jgi:probable DNA repair protein